MKTIHLSVSIEAFIKPCSWHLWTNCETNQVIFMTKSCGGKVCKNTYPRLKPADMWHVALNLSNESKHLLTFLNSYHPMPSHWQFVKFNSYDHFLIVKIILRHVQGAAILFTEIEWVMSSTTWIRMKIYYSIILSCYTSIKWGLLCQKQVW